MTTKRFPFLRRVLAGALALLGASAALTVATGTTASAAAVDCSANCIESLTITPDGKLLKATTSVAAYLEVDIFSDPGRTQGVAAMVAPWIPGGVRAFDLPVRAFTYDPLQVIKPKIQLPAATKLYVRAYAYDTKGHVRIQDYDITTYQRRLKVTVIKLVVQEDSDFAGAGELTFHVRAAGSAAKVLLSQRSIAAPRTLTGLGTFVFDGMPTTIALQVRGQDDDCEFSTCYVAAGNWGKGDTANNDWTTATTTIVIGGTSGAEGGSFVASVWGLPAFEASGTWTHEYIKVA